MAEHPLAFLTGRAVPADEAVLILAPMAGYSDRAFRVLCRRFGADAVVTEMISAKAICFGDRKTAALGRIGAEELPCALQLFGSDPDTLAHAAAVVSGGMGGGLAPVAIDINMGCPVRKIVSNGEGSALMRNPPLVRRIVEAVRRATPLPVTVKIRAGYDGDHINAPMVAQYAEEGGARAVTVHGRTRAQGYSGQADRSVIAAVCRAVSVPVIGNGDVVDGESAARMLDTGCAGLMIGRGAVGNPFVFTEIRAHLSGKEYDPPDLRARAATAEEQLRLAAEDKGEAIAVAEARKQLVAYFHSFRGASGWRREMQQAQNMAEMVELLHRACGTFASDISDAINP